MGTKTLRLAALTGLLISTTACGSAATPAGGATSSPLPIAAQDPPVTLRLGIADPIDRSTTPFVTAFVDRVNALSNDNVTIEPLYAAGDGTDAGFETAVNEKVKAGDLEFSLTGSRSWDLTGVTSLRALQAPFLIDSDDLAIAVAKDAIASRALDGMTGAGVVGLALWPEELRHLFSFPNCDKDYRTPSGIAGAEIGIIPSQVSRDIVEALGGIDSAFDTGGGDSEACRLQGVERGLTGTGVPLAFAVATSNVVLFPKYQVLAANADALGRLSEGQQAVIRQAVTEAQADAMTRVPNEETLAASWCERGGTVEVASADQIEDLRLATASVMADLEQDALTKELIEAIDELKKSVAAPVFDGTCEPPVATGSEPSVAPQDTTGFVATAIPDGTYRTEITEADLIAKGASAAFAAKNAGVKTWIFKGGTFAQEHGDCEGTYEIVPDRYITWHGCDVDGGHSMWRPDGDGIRLLPLLDDGLSAMDRIEVAAYFDRVMTKID